MSHDSKELLIQRENAHSEEDEYCIYAISSPSSEENEDPGDRQEGGQIYVYPEAFQDPKPVPDSLLSLSNHVSAWQFLDQGNYNAVVYTTEPHAYSNNSDYSQIVKKESFSSKSIYIYRTQETQFHIRIGQHFFVCKVISHNPCLILADSRLSPTTVLAIEKKHQWVFILNGTGLYRLRLGKKSLQIVTQNTEHISQFQMIIQQDLRAAKQHYFKMTTKTIAAMQAVCPEFCQNYDPEPEIYNSKFRSARLLSEFYPQIQFYPIDNRTLLMPYFAGNATASDVIQEAIRLLFEYGRIVTDMSILKNFKKDRNGVVYCIDPDMALSVGTRRLSKASIQINNYFVYAGGEEFAINDYHAFLEKMRTQRSEEESRVAIATLALLYLARHFDLNQISRKWVDEPWLQMVYIFSTRDYSLALGDLEIIHSFKAVFVEVCSYLDMQGVTAYQIYYFVLREWIEQDNLANVRTMLEHLTAETVNKIFSVQRPHTLLSIAVLSSQASLVTLLLEFSANPLLDEGSDYCAIDWAIYAGAWGMLEQLLKAIAVKNSIDPHRYRLWTGSAIPLQTLKENMIELDSASDFHSHLQRLKSLANLCGNREYAEMVHELIKFCLQFFTNQSDNLAKRKVVFINNCKRILNESLPNIDDQEVAAKMESAIQALKNDLSLAQDPTPSCILS
jgi:hypothetical protein